MTIETAENIPLLCPTSDLYAEERKENLSLASALVKLRTKYLQEAHSCLDNQINLIKAIEDLTKSIESTDSQDVVFIPLREEIFKKLQVAFVLLKKSRIEGFNEQTMNQKADIFLRNGSWLELHELLLTFLKYHDKFYHKSALESMSRIKAAAFICQEKKVQETHNEASVSVTLHEDKEKSPSEEILCDNKLLASLGKAVDHSDLVINTMLDKLELQNTNRSEIRVLIQKIAMLPERVTSIDSHPELISIIKNLQTKLDLNRFKWSCEEEKRTLSNELLHLLTESSYDTKLIYSKLSQEISRRGEYVKVFGHIINSLLECEMKFLKNMRW